MRVLGSWKKFVSDEICVASAKSCQDEVRRETITAERLWKNGTGPERKRRKPWKTSGREGACPNFFTASERDDHLENPTVFLFALYV
jgi:hypothetical protein